MARAYGADPAAVLRRPGHRLVRFVATAAGGIPEVVEDGKTGLLVPPRDPRALADALHVLLTDEARARSLGAAGRRRFLASFSAAHMVEETLKTYAEAP